MQTAQKTAFALLISGLLILAGCGGPVVTVTHLMPAPVPLPAETVRVEIQGFTVNGDSEDKQATLATQTVLRRRPKQWAGEGDRPEGQTVLVGGRVHVDIVDTAGSRIVRRRCAADGSLKDEHLDTLVRKVNVKVDFVLNQPGRDEPLVTVETRRDYSSAGDPRLRGELGLERADDPQRVPAAETIIQELLAGCADSFWAMVTPVELSEQIELRPVAGSDASAGLKAAGQGEFDSALASFQAAMEARGEDVDLLFNSAVVAEIAGRLDLAAKHYRRASALSNGHDVQAAQGARRVSRLLLHQQQ